MAIKFPNIKISEKLLSDLRAAGLIDEVMLRNLYIKKEFSRRSKNRKLGSKKTVIKKLAKELNMRPETIGNIIYQKHNRKKPIIINIKELK